MAGLILGLIQINTVDFVWKQWHRNLLTVGVAAAVSAFNAYAAGHLSIAEGMFAVCHIYAVVPILAALWVFAPKRSAAEVFLHFTDYDTAWPSTTLTVLVGQLPSIFIVMGNEAVATSIAEEVEHPDIILPRCILWSFLANMPVVLAVLLTYAFNMVSLEDVTAGKFSAMEVFVNALRSTRATTGFATVVLVLMFMVAVSTMVSTSRHLFAFGRDRALYCSPWFSRVHPTLKVPLNAIHSTLFFTTVVSLLTSASHTPLNTIMGLSVATLMSTYLLSIGSLLIKRIKGLPIPPAKWSLGRSGIYINAIAIIYALWAWFWSFWPMHYGVKDASRFNWTLVLYFFVIGYSMVFFVLRQRDLRKRPMEIVPTWTPRLASS